MVKKYFLTFGGGDNQSIQKSYHAAVKRITNQVEELKMFDYIYPKTEIDLKNDEVFWNKHKNFIINSSKGYGYWLWKPYLIMKTMEEMEDNDILLYADAGCIIQDCHKSELTRLFEKVESDLIIASLTCNENGYSKMDLIKHLDMENSKLLRVNQIQASAIIIKKCKKTMNLVKEWYNISCNYHLIDDSPSIEPNTESFKEHRHDQSIFSLLVKKYDIHKGGAEDINKGVYIARFRRGY